MRWVELNEEQYMYCIHVYIYIEVSSMQFLKWMCVYWSAVLHVCTLNQNVLLRGVLQKPLIRDLYSGTLN